MSRRILRSASHASSGLAFACRTERNLRLFLWGYLPLLLFSSLLLPLGKEEVLLFLISGGLFVCVELINTALERLADAADDHCTSAHQSYCFVTVKHAKDVAAAASLVSLIVVVLVFFIVIVPHVLSGRVPLGLFW